MTDVLNLSIDIYRKKTKNSGTMQRIHSSNFTLEEGDEIKLSVMNVEKSRTSNQKVIK